MLISETRINDLLVERKIAKNNKNWARADEIRNEFSSKGYKILDYPDGSSKLEKK